jgi:hypothetical protein
MTCCVQPWKALSIALIQRAEELHERIIQKKNAQQGTALLQFQATNEKTYPLYNIQVKESSPSTGFMPVSPVLTS